jgi:hypothetical protein
MQMQDDFILDIVNKEIHESGIYRFEWAVYGSQKKGSTFFPHTWSEEMVQKKIIEAYEYARKHNIPPKFQPDTKNFLVSGFTNDGIAIAMLISSAGNMVVAFPKWPL